MNSRCVYPGTVIKAVETGGAHAGRMDTLLPEPLLFLQIDA